MDKEIEELKEKIDSLKDWIFAEIINLQKQIDDLKEKLEEIKFEKGNYYVE
ncbi:MAG: hypothetical protein QW795_03560 [Candidatus Bathyarchaeia archaeon]